VTSTADITSSTRKESAERQLSTNHTRTNCETTESRTGNRTSSPPPSSSPASDQLQTHFSPQQKYTTLFRLRFPPPVLFIQPRGSGTLRDANPGDPGVWVCLPALITNKLTILPTPTVIMWNCGSKTISDFSSCVQRDYLLL